MTDSYDGHDSFDPGFEPGFDGEPEDRTAPHDARTNERLSNYWVPASGGAASSGTGGVSAVWDFTMLAGTAEEEAQGALEDWVTDILGGWYDLVGEDQVSGAEYRRLRVPVCWARHSDVRTELGWLAQTWYRAVRHDGGDLSAVAEWHTRYLPAAVERIRRASSACACSYQHTELP